MEGPSLFLASEQLAPFIGQKIQKVSGNTKIGKERLLKHKILSIFSYGKYLFFQFETFALRVHFLLYGSFEATINRRKVTGDYPKKNRIPRLSMQLKNGHIEMYNCSIRYIEQNNAKASCDYSIDIMSDSWDGQKAYLKVKNLPEHEIADVLLDQSIFLGVGNIIKNEVLLLVKVSPFRKVKELSERKLKSIVDHTRKYVFHFYKWRKKFELKKHYQVYRQSICKICGTKVLRKRTGERQRISFICPHCEK